MTIDEVAPLKPIMVDQETASFLTSLSTAVIEKMEQKGEFPKARLLSKRRVGYLYDEIVAWCLARPVSDLPPPANTGRHKATSRGPVALQDAETVS